MKLSALLHSKLFIGIAAGVTAAAAATTAFFLTHKSDEEYRVIKVFEKTGTSIVTRPDVGDIKPYVGMNLESGDSVCTYKDSTMRISLDNTKYMFMEPETKLELEASGDKNDNRTKIILKSGSVLNEITKPLSSDSSYVVSAPKASMAVHGTSFRVFVEKVGDDYIITLYAFEGTVKVTLLDENGNDTNKTASVSKDKCVKIKTVHNSSKDPSEDGTSFFVYQNEKGELDPVPEGESPLMDFNYEDIPYETLKEVFDTDKDDELKLSPEVLKKVIDAMTKGGGDPNETTTTTTVTTEETTTTTEEETTTTPEETTTTGEETTTTPEETTTTPEETTTTGEETTTTPTETTTTPATTVPPETTTTQSSAVTTTTSETTSTQSSTGTTPVTSGTTDTTTSESVPPAEDLFTVRFVDRSGNVISSQIVKKGGSAQAPSNITQSYTSGGWTMLFDGWDTDFTNVQSDLTIKPVYKAKQRFTVTFYDYDGSVLSTQTVEKDNGASEPEGYTKTYVHSSTGRTMVFDGWDTDFSNIQADTSVKPVYKEAPVYTVTFYGHNGEKLSTQEVEQGKSATKPADPESYTDDDGWTMEFDKWDTDFTDVQEDLDVTAVYKARARYTVQFYTHGGVKYGSAQTVEKGKSATKPADPESYTDDDGWTMEFDKWDTDFTNVQKDLKVTAEYKARARYTVQFYTHGGVKYGSAQTVEKGKSATKPTNPSSYTDDDGWTMEFDKWDTDFTDVQKDLDVTAVYKARARYTVQFYTHGGVKYGSAQTVEKGKSAKKPTNPSSYTDDDGWTMEFDKWDTDFTDVQEDLDVTAVYKARERFTVQFYTHGGVKYGSAQTIEKGKSATKPANPSSYTDDGWTMEFDKWDTDFTDVQEDLDVTAVYKARERFTVQFYTHGGVKYGSAQTVEKGKSATKPANPSSYTDDDGWTMEFDKWDTDFTDVQEDLDVTAEYKARARYTVQFYTHGGVKYGSAQTVEKGKSATKPTDPESYTDGDGISWVFDKWDTSFSKVEKDLDVTAVYKRGVLIRFLDYSKTVVKKQIVEKGGSGTPPTVPETVNTSDGTLYFGGWTDYTNVEEDCDSQAIYGKHTHVSLYDMRGNSPDSSMTPSEEQVAGSKFVLPDYVTSGDYNEGWFQSTSGMKATSTEPTGSATLSNDSNENIYLLMRYSNSPFEEYVNDVLETSAECTMFRDTDGSYYFVSGEGAYLSTAICDSSGNGTVNGIPLNVCTFETNFGSNVSYSTLYTLMQDKTNNVKVTKVRLDLLKDPRVDDY